MANPAKPNVSQRITLPPALLRDSTKRAKGLGLSFSAFVQKCLERDLSDQPEVILQESGGTAQMSAVPALAPTVTTKVKKSGK